MDNFVGNVVDGKYKVERLLGRGGMGAVYYAVHLGTKRAVALKVIIERHLRDPEFLERFKREAEAVGRLRHPNVVDVTDFGFASVSGRPIAYLVMEYLDGCSLDEVLKEEKKLSLRWTVDILEQICAAVSEAHRLGIIHRDLKPENIWLEPNRRGGHTAKVLDFGIARIDDEESDGVVSGLPQSPSMPDTRQLSDVPTTMIVDQNAKIHTISELDTIAVPQNTAQKENLAVRDNSAETAPQTLILSEENIDAGTDAYRRSTSEITRVGTIMGTPTYMSPEQCGGERLSHLTDIYSLGIIAYEMLSGKRPFEGEPLSVIAAHIEGRPPRLKASGIPRKVRKTVHRAIAKNPMERPASADVFAAQMRSHSEGVLSILRRSLLIYLENFSRLIWFSLLLYLPTIFFGFVDLGTGLVSYAQVLPPLAITIFSGVVKFFNIFFTIAAETLIFGAAAWIVVQYIQAPLRPFRILEAFRVLLQRWKQWIWVIPMRFVISYLMQGDLTALAVPLVFFFSFIETILFWALPIVIVLESLTGFNALRRGWRLSWEVLWTVVRVQFLQFLATLVLHVSVVLVILSLTNYLAMMVFQIDENYAAFYSSTANAIGLIIVKLLGTLLLPFFGVVASLTYVKARNARGEPLSTVLAQFRDLDSQKQGWRGKVSTSFTV